MSDLPAGDFASWLSEVLEAIEGDGTTDVPCGTCVGCCSSSQFVHIAPDEKDALAHIPKALLFPAPRMPRGHLLMGYDERGRCPMLRAEGCSIYEHRPRTCRTYDCRVFPAAGALPDEPDKALIATQAARWQFSFEDPAANEAAAAVRTAAVFLHDHRAELGDAARDDQRLPPTDGRSLLARLHGGEQSSDNPQLLLDFHVHTALTNWPRTREWFSRHPRMESRWLLGCSNAQIRLCHHGTGGGDGGSACGRGTSGAAGDGTRGR